MIASEVSSLAATVLGAWLTRNFTAIIFGLIVRALVLSALSHLLSKRRYKLSWSAGDAPRFIHFALPLMLNGFMLFVGSQGDRVTVARELGASAIGHYQAVILLIFYPCALVQRYMHVLFLPLVAGARDDAAKRDHIVELMGGLTFVLAVAMAAGFALVAPTMVPILYGGRFTEAPLIVGLMGILQTARFLINWPTTVNLARGHTRAVLLASIARLLVFPGAYIGVHTLGGIPGVVIGFGAGELISVVVGVALMNGHVARPWFWGFDRLAYFAVASLAIAGWDYAFVWRSLPLAATMLVLTAGLIFWIVRRETVTIAAARELTQRLSKPMLLRLGFAR